MFKGFFNRMYNGNPNRPDIDPEDMPKNKFELFFTTLGLRIGDLIKLNLLAVVMLLPIILWTLLNAAAFVTGLVKPDGTILSQDELMNHMLGLLSSYLFWNLILLPLAGPPIAGMTYIARNYARDEHAWLWSDFKEQMKKNWKQSMVVMLVLAVVLYIVFITLQFYAAAMQSQSWMWVMQLVFITFVGMFILSYMYVFPLLVTYKLKIGQIIKNSMMLALGRLPFTLMFGFMAIFPVILAVLITLTFGMDPSSPVISYTVIGLLLYYLLLGFSLTSFILNSYTNATFDKLLKTEEDIPDSGDPAGQDKP